MIAQARIPATVIALLAFALAAPLSCYYGPATIVEFDPNFEGASISIPAQAVPPGGRVEAPEEPYRDGYEFKGWFREAQTLTTWDFTNDVVEGPLTLYAGWEGLPPEENAYLASLSADQGILSPSFSPPVLDYSLMVGIDVSSVTLSGIPAIAEASVTGPLTLSDLVAGEPRQAVLTVTSSNGMNSKDYRVTVRRATEDDLPPTDGINASRTEGVAPLLVHFTAGTMETEADSESFLMDEYRWDFGDPESGTWSTTGKDENSATGGVAAHVYDRPGTYLVSLTRRDAAGNTAGDELTITVLDPEEVYSGDKTICVSDIDDFSGAPAGSQHIISTDLTYIASLAHAGTRILFRRGGSWTTANMSQTWRVNEGPVTLGAYGEGTNPDEWGLFGNAPLITLSGGEGFIISLNSKRDWRIMDLHFDDPSDSRITNGIDASYEYKDILIYRMRISGFNTGICLSHWNRDPVVTIERNAIVSCYIHDLGEYGIYGGSERLAVLGNRVRDVGDEHVVRIWQAWHSVISHNILSGASLTSTKGDHDLKLHGPGIGDDNCLGPALPNTYNLERRTDYVVVSDNIFGSSGPWPVMIAPTNQGQDENLSNIVFERNRIATGFGNIVRNVDVSLRVSANRIVVRNNIMDGTGSSPDYIGIVVTRHGVEPPPSRVFVYNNTVYRADNESGGYRIGISVGPEVESVELVNNLVSYPSSLAAPSLITDSSGIALTLTNLLSEDPLFVDPDNADPLLRDFSLYSGSPAIDTGTALAVYDDFHGNPRPLGPFDMGAVEQ